MKAVVLAGGQGTRLRPITYSVPKQLIPVGGRPVLGHVFEDIAECGITETIVITSPESYGPVGEFTASLDLGMDFELVLQEEPNGLAAAFQLAVPKLGSDSSLLFLGDCLLTGGIAHLVEQHNATGAAATILLREVDDPSRYGIVALDDGRVVRLVEKPPEPPTNLAIVGVYAFGPEINDAVGSIEPSGRGEYEITDAIQLLVDRGGDVRPAELNGWWIDTGTVDDVLAAHARILDTEGVSSVIHPTARVGDSELIGPVVIDAGAEVSESVVGPHVHISKGARVAGSQIESSIVMEDSLVEGASLKRSLLGPRSKVTGATGVGLQVVIGSDASLAGQLSQSG